MAEPTKAQQDILSKMRSRLKIAISAYSNTREDQIEDLKFLAGSPDNQWQWPADVLSTRGSVQGQTINARPCLTINKLPQHVRQVTNEQRQNRPSGKVIPVDDKADTEIAEIYEGMIRHIEYISDADVAYDTACENQVAHGEGFIRIITDYCEPDSFDQDIKIVRVRNPFSVFMDPLIQDPCGSDAQWCLITDDLRKEDYERDYPNASATSGLMSMAVGDQSVGLWINENTVRIAEYFYIEYTTKTLNLYPANVTAFEGTVQDKQLRAVYGRPIKSRKSQIPQVKWIKTNGFEIFDEREWVGKWIPVVRVVGNEYEIEGELHISGLVRNAKDAQRMYNYWTSQEAEMLALAPKAPFIGYAGQFEGYEQYWKTANTNNWPYLEVNPEVADGQGNPLPLPQRAAPPMAQHGLIAAKMGAADDIKSTTGQYDSSLGQTSNERSGRAILAREEQSDTGTYHYVDNLSRAVKYVARQIVDLIPKIYDTERIARIIGIDGETKMVRINPSQDQAVNKVQDPNNPEIVLEKIYNLGVGKYDVVVTTGPSYMTKRQKAMEAMGQILQGNKELWMIAGDLFVKNMDWPGAKELAARLARAIDPKLLEDKDDPALQAAKKQIEEMGMVMEQMQQMLASVQDSFEARELQIKQFSEDIRAYDAETKRLATFAEAVTPEQIQDIVRGTIAAMLDTGDLVQGSPGAPLLPSGPLDGGGGMDMVSSGAAPSEV